MGKRKTGESKGVKSGVRSPGLARVRDSLPAHCLERVGQLGSCETVWGVLGGISHFPLACGHPTHLH